MTMYVPRSPTWVIVFVLNSLNVQIRKHQFTCVQHLLEIEHHCTFMCPSSPSLSGPGSSSRLCKRALYSYFFQVAQQKYLLKLPTYYSVKVGATLITSAKPWFLSLMMSLLTGSSLRLPDSQRSGEATVSEQPWRTLELKEPGGLLQYWMSLQKFSWILCEGVCDGDTRL